MTAAATRGLRRRLLPLQVAVGLQGIILWVPVEKLFMTEIGFDPASVGVMAAAYAAAVPLLEVPSGILADRWSRRGVLVLACLGLMASTLLGGLSHNVAAYIAAALVLAVYFAMSSGTLDSAVYDTVLEETGSSDAYETWIGRVRLVEGAAFAASAVVGGVLAEATSTRFTYFATLPFAALAILAFLRFDEPTLHRSAEPVPLRRHIYQTFRAMTERRHVLGVITLAALVALISQTVIEFGPLWLVALAAPAALYGPYWAAVVGTLGVGGLLASRLRLGNPVPAGLLGVVMAAAALALTLSGSLAVVIPAQVVLALAVVAAGVHISRLLHDAVPSNVRAGVASGVGTLSWLIFLPFSLVFGALANAQGVHTAGWTFTATALLVGGLLLRAALRPPPAVVQAPPAELTCQQFVEKVTDLLDRALDPVQQTRCEEHASGCDGCTEYLAQIRHTIDAMRAHPAPHAP